MFQLQHPVIPLVLTSLESNFESQRLIEHLIFMILYFLITDFYIIVLQPYFANLEHDPFVYRSPEGGFWDLFVNLCNLVFVLLLHILAFLSKIPF